jgi:C4-dicarboxylate-specific signal transduction histidine kinase
MENKSKIPYWGIIFGVIYALIVTIVGMAYAGVELSWSSWLKFSEGHIIYKIAIISIPIEFSVINFFARRAFKQGVKLAEKDWESFEKDQIIKDQADKIQEAAKLSALGEMAGGIAHEINNPLTVLNGNNVLIRRILIKNNLYEGRASEMIEKNERTIFRITKIIQNLRKLARNENNEVKEFELFKLIEDVKDMADIRLNGKNTKLIVIEECENLKINSNQEMLAQVMVNLINNAVDATGNKPGTFVKVFIRNYGDLINIRVMDNGDGIPKEIAEKIFEPMFTTKGVGKGTGLGLSLSKSILENLGGTLNLVDVDQGTCFELKFKSLPKEEKESEKKAA